MHIFPSARDFIIQTLNSIHRLHSHDWVHGDISAENLVFQTMTDEDFRNIKMWKLLDLPFLSYFPENRHKPLFGSLYTMAPERFEGKAPDYRSDLYSLGCLYYLALKGTFPHIGSRAEIAIGHVKFEPELLDFGPDDTLLPEWVAKMMHKNPEKRFKSAAEARAGLSRIFGQITKL
jgi:serine/threonine protein kinase